MNRRTEDPRVWIAFAHPREGRALDEERGLRLLELGVGKVAAAVSLCHALDEARPLRVVLVGICGAYPGRHAGGEQVLEVGDACVVRESVFGDEGLEDEDGFHSLADLDLGSDGPWPTDSATAQALADEFGLPLVRCATVSTCSGRDARSAAVSARTRADVETMESAAVAQVCARFEVPLTEIRVVSNYTGDREHAAWRLGEAADRAQDLVMEAWRAGLLGEHVELEGA